MILITRINDRDIYINPDHIEYIEEIPDTTVTTITGKKIIVRDSVEEIINKIIDYKRRFNI
jgi:flagellar protein FlbD